MKTTAQNKKHLPLFAKILIGMALGVGFGFLAIVFHGDEFVRDWVAPLGVIFMRLLKLIAVPLVLVSLVLGVVSLKDIKSLSRIGLKTILIYVCTTILAVSFGLVMVNLIKPGNLFPKDKQNEFVERYQQTLTEREAQMEMVRNDSPLKPIVDIVPENVFQAFSSNSQMLQVIFFAILFGVALVCVGQSKTGSVIRFFQQLNLVLLKIIDFIMAFAPLGVFALMAGFADCRVGLSCHHFLGLSDHLTPVQQKETRPVFQSGFPCSDVGLFNQFQCGHPASDDGAHTEAFGRF